MLTAVIGRAESLDQLSEMTQGDPTNRLVKWAAYGTAAASPSTSSDSVQRRSYEESVK